MIGSFSAQQTLDQCYISGLAAACANVVRVDGDLTSPASGIQLFTTNLKFERAEGIEVGFNFGIDLDAYGDLQFSGMINKYLTQESQSDANTPIIDCNGFFGTSCDPISELSWTQRTTWNWNSFTASLQWRHIDSVDVERPEFANTFSAFTSIDDYDYLDLYASYTLWDDRVRLSLGIENITDEDVPILGNESGDTSSNFGNTYPSNYSVYGRVYTAGARLTF